MSKDLIGAAELGVGQPCTAPGQFKSRKGAKRVSQGCCQVVVKLSQGSRKDVARLSQGCRQVVARVLPGCRQGVARVTFLHPCDF